MTPRRRGDHWKALPGVGAYAAVCLFLASAAWMAAGTAAAQSVPTPTEPLVSLNATDSPQPTATVAGPAATPTPEATPTFDPTPTIAPTPAPFNYDIYKDNTFVSQVTTHACMAGATLNMLNIIGPTVDRTTARQIAVSQTLVANTTKEDSHNGGYGPAAWAITLTQMGAGNYKLLVDDTLTQAMHDATVALRRTGRPVGLLSWWGAHSWVMTGFRTDRDPRKYSSFTVYGAYIVDPFYPRHSSIWGYTMGPDTYRNWGDLVHNYIGWKRPEGHYPGRDGKWLLVVPY